MKKIFISVLISIFTVPFFALAAENTATSANQSYYLLSVIWNSEKNSLSLNGDVTLTSQNLLKDTGSGSQFYARVINFSDKPEPFKVGDYKLFLGKWQLDGSAKKGEVKVTVPYFVDGSKVILVDSRSKKIILAVDVSKLAKVKTSAANAGKKVTVSAKTPAAGALTYQIGGHSAAYWWTMRILILAILVGGGYGVYRWRKKKRAAQAEAVVNLTQSKK